ncbi:MAG TPA: hypothetical protein VM537_13200, partial [Anaerolineae bacterium]|nr:hypothetical protein [Anaerolineae bacterium]
GRGDLEDAAGPHLDHRVADVGLGLADESDLFVPLSRPFYDPFRACPRLAESTPRAQQPAEPIARRW